MDEDVQVPTVKQLVPVVFEALQQLGGSGARSDIRQRVAKSLALSDSVLEKTTDDGSELLFSRNFGFALSMLKKNGQVANSAAGVWRLALAPYVGEDPATPAGGAEVSVSAGVETTEDMSSVMLLGPLSDDNEWKAKLLKMLRAIQPAKFEMLCLRLLRETGFRDLQWTGGCNDGGIDGYGEFDIGLLSFRVAFQAKRTSSALGPDVVRELRGASKHNPDQCLLITTSSFTAYAHEEAKLPGRQVRLIDGLQLCDLMLKYNMGIKTVDVPTVRADPGRFF